MKQHTTVIAAPMLNTGHRFAVIALTLFLGALLAACGDATAQPTPGAGAMEEGTALPGPGDLQATPDTGVGQTTPDTDDELTENIGPDSGAISLSDIADNPEQYIGQTVTLRAPLGEVLGPRAFTLSDPAVLGFDSLLVVGVNEGTIPMEEEAFGMDAAENVEDAEIEVTGVVRAFDVTALEQELNYEFPEPILGAYSEETALVADSVRVLSETE